MLMLYILVNNFSVMLGQFTVLNPGLNEDNDVTMNAVPPTNMALATLSFFDYLYN